MKKISLVLICLLCCIALTGCEDETSTKSKKKEKDSNLLLPFEVDKDPIEDKEDRDEEETLKNEEIEVPDGYGLVVMQASLDSTYGNSIAPGDTIDLYIRITKDDGTIIYGKLFGNLKVIKVVDASNNSYYDEEFTTPAQLVVMLSDDDMLVVRKAMLLKNMKVSYVPRNSSYSSDDGTMVGSQEILDYILNYNVIDEDQTN